jgi:teichuronic acid biosynthesis glycosyltransferase TuaC
LNDKNTMLIPLFSISQALLVDYYNASDVMVLPSYHEGSPNVIKEAMACNCPIVATDVGDVKWVLGDTEGCYIAGFEPDDFAEKLRLALGFAETKGKTSGRYRILELGLDSDTIAKKIVVVYESVLK